jgi:release factor glutamine methyltransferase
MTYLSSDDSQLLRQVAKMYRGTRCAEIGIGYASNLVELSGHFEEIIGTDIRLTDGFEILKNKGFSLVVSDRTTCFKDEIFDLVITNPPYLPSEGITDPTVDGGTGGFEIPSSFLREALRVLRPAGAILIVISSETSTLQFKRFCAENNLRVKEIVEKSLFFETLTAYELRKTEIERDLKD